MVDASVRFTREDIDAGDYTFPKELPEELLPFYALNGFIPVTKCRSFFRDAHLGKEALNNVWSE